MTAPELGEPRWGATRRRTAPAPAAAAPTVDLADLQRLAARRAQSLAADQPADDPDVTDSLGAARRLAARRAAAAPDSPQED